VKIAQAKWDYIVRSVRRSYGLAFLGGASVPKFDTVYWRGRNDDGTETTATWKQPVNTDWGNQAEDTTFRLRFAVLQLGGPSSIQQFRCEYSRNSGAWTPCDQIGPTKAVYPGATGNFADKASTTQQISSGKFVTPNAGMSKSADGIAGETARCEPDAFIELEFSLRIRNTSTDPGDEIRLRVQSLTGTMTKYRGPIITVSTGGTPGGGGHESG